MDVNLRPLRQRDDALGSVRASINLLPGGKPQLVVVSGLRRVGKTLLVRHLLAATADEVVTVYFEATEGAESRELARFHRCLLEAVGPALPGGPVPTSWEQALALVVFVARQRPIVVVIDEATYLMVSTPSFASQVQAVWDGLILESQPPRIGLILTGSQIGLTEDALSSQGALYQRPTQTMRIEPFTPAEAYRFTGAPEPAAFLEAYSACGGYPLHLDAWDFAASTSENLLRLAGSPGGVLLEDGNLTLARLSEAARRVLIAVGSGRSKVSEIANELGSRPERQLEGLSRARLIHQRRPLGAPRQARGSYRVSDTYLRFYFSVLASNVQLIEGGQGEAVLAHAEPQWLGHVGAVFEDAARQHATRLVQRGELPSGILIGEWWTTSGQPVQVDVLGVNPERRIVVVGEAKWQKRPLGHHELNELAGKLRSLPDSIPQPTFLLYGRGGARPEIISDRVLGFDVGDVVGG